MILLGLYMKGVNKFVQRCMTKCAIKCIIMYQAVMCILICLIYLGIIIINYRILCYESTFIVMKVILVATSRAHNVYISREQRPIHVANLL